MISTREDGLSRCDCDGNIRWLSERGETLIVYALCGFSNLGAMGIMLGGMNGLAPKRVKTFSELVFLALIGGTMSCFARACITSLLYESSGTFNWGGRSIIGYTFDGKITIILVLVVEGYVASFSFYKSRLYRNFFITDKLSVTLYG